MVPGIGGVRYEDNFIVNGQTPLQLTRPIGWSVSRFNTIGELGRTYADWNSPLQTTWVPVKHVHCLLMGNLPVHACWGSIPLGARMPSSRAARRASSLARHSYRGLIR